MTTVVDIRILGALEMVVDRESLHLSSPRVRQLLALLALHSNEVVPFERIVDVLWEEPPASARQQVHNVVGNLRRVLRPASHHVSLATNGVGYSLQCSPGIVDAARFRANMQATQALSSRPDEAVRLLQAALDEWRGSALSGLPSPYLANAATVLTDQRLAAVEQLAELRLQHGDPSASVPMLVDLVQEFPFRESLRAVLMRAFHATGRQADALSLFERGRLLLAEELGLDPGPLLQSAHQEVLSGGANLGFATPGPLSPIGPAPVEQQAARSTDRNFLPPDIHEFTGRGEELQQLVDNACQVATPALVISAINGMGGVGKTTLAVHLAHRLTVKYPDGQYFVDLQGFSAGAEPLSPAAALKLLLLSSGTQPELIPTDLEARVALWRANVADRRVLLLLDNAQDAAQVRPLLPGTSGSLVLISSRRRMPSLEGAIPLSLDVLPDCDAQTLFRRIAGPERATAEPTAVAAVVELCGCLPLAIQIAAARLRDRPNWTVKDVVSQLRDHRARSRFLATGDKDVTAVLTWSYRQLPEEQQRLFRLLALHSGPDVSPAAAAALAGLAPHQAQDALEELYEVNLVQQQAPSRYHFHDLVRDCSLSILERCDAAERATAVHRLLDYYLRAAHSWSQQLMRSHFQFEPHVVYEPEYVEPAGSRDEAVEFFEREYRNFLAAIRLATQADSPEHVWQLTCSLIPYLNLRFNQSAETETLYREALTAARRLDDATGQAVSLMGLAHVRRTQGAATEAMELARQAIEFSSREEHRPRLIYQWAGLGIMLVDENRFAEAFDCFSNAMSLAEVDGDKETLAGLTNNLGVICRELGQLDEALDYFRSTLRLDAEADSESSQALTLCNIGEIHYLQGKTTDAVVAFERALAVSRARSSPRGEAVAAIGLSTTSRQLGDFSAALAYGREALEAARASEWHDLEGDALNALSDAHVCLGDVDTAEQVLHQAIRVAGEFATPRYLARASEGLAHVALARGDSFAAQQHWRKALKTAPGGVVDAGAARNHLNAGPGEPVTCWRCILEHPKGTTDARSNTKGRHRTETP